jgi:hypothetical protein
MVAAVVAAVVVGGVIYFTKGNGGAHSGQEIEAMVHMDPG